jgi:hypothetical protein
VNKRDHDLFTHRNRFNDIEGSFDKIKSTISLGKLLQTFLLVAATANEFSIFSSEENMM